MQIKWPSSWWLFFLSIAALLMGVSMVGLITVPPILTGLCLIVAGILGLFGR